MRKYVTLIRQHEEKDCGAACLSMILQHFGKKLPLATVAEEVKTDQYGTNIYGLIDGANRLGLSGVALEGTAEDLLAETKARKIKLPYIVRIINDQGFEHYVVVTGITRNTVFICDPGQGRRRISAKAFRKLFLGQAVIFKKTAAFRKGNMRKGAIMEFVRLITKQKGLIALIAFLSLLVTAVSLLGTFLFQFLIDSVLPEINATHLHSESYGGLEVFAVMLSAVGILYVVRFLVQLLRGRLLAFMTKRINLPLMLGYCDNLMDLKIDFFGSHKTGDLISRFHDASKVQEALSNVTLTLMIDVVMVIFCGFTLYQRSSTLFFVALAIMLLYTLITAFYIRPLDKKTRELTADNSVLHSYLKESIDGIQTVKAINAGTVIKAKINSMFTALQNKATKATMLSVGKETLIELVTSVGTLCLLWVGVLNIASGEMSLGVLMMFYTLLGYFISPIQNVINLQSSIQAAVIAAGRLRDILDRSKEDDHQCEENLRFENGSIVLKNVDFRYGNRAKVLSNVNIEIQPSTHVAFVGASGSGKTTATKLLMGFYSPESGQVTIGGRPISSMGVEDLRENVSYVPQNTFLFSDTVKNNLLLGNKRHITDEELRCVLSLCGCDFIEHLPLGLDTMLEEGGENLSGGQRQQLAVARALLRKPHILILDEATSNMDVLAEKKLLQALRAFDPNMTVVMVVHRLNATKNCDNILLFEDGHIAETGTHQQLLNMQGKYASLWNSGISEQN